MIAPPANLEATLSKSQQRSSKLADSWLPKKLVWVGNDSGLPDPNLNILSGSLVPVGTEDINDNPLIPPCFKPTQLKHIAKTCGEQWSYTKGAAHTEIHQSIVIFSEIARLSGCEAEYWTWPKLLTTLLKKNVATNSEIEDKTLLYFCWTTEPDLGMTQLVYRILEEMGNLPTDAKRVRCYPHIHDLQESERKLGDIQALDEIAAAATTQQHRFRPKTCIETSPCTLREPFVMKRTHSSTSSHVDLAPEKTAWKRLPCRAGHDPTASREPVIARKMNYNKTTVAQLKAACKERKLDTTRVVNVRVKAEYIALLQQHESVRPNPLSTGLSHIASQPASAPRWFHQQKVPSLIDFGEFRVIVATLPSPDGLRGRKGHVFEAFHTKPRQNPQKSLDDQPNPIVSTMSRVPDELLSKEYCGTKTYSDLADFSLWIFEELRRYKPLMKSTVEQGSSSVDKAFQSVADKENVSPDYAGEKRKASHVSNTTPFRKVRKGNCGESILTACRPTQRSGGMFESLEIGVRLDIGSCSAADGHRFFVNEITRSWYGDLISYKSGEPRTRICSALARAGCEYFFGERGAEGV